MTADIQDNSIQARSPLEGVIYELSGSGAACTASQVMDSVWDSGRANKTSQVWAHQGFSALLSSTLPVVESWLWQSLAQIQLIQARLHSLPFGFAPPQTRLHILIIPLGDKVGLTRLSTLYFVPLLIVSHGFPYSCSAPKPQ